MLARLLARRSHDSHQLQAVLHQAHKLCHVSGTHIVFHCTNNHASNTHQARIADALAATSQRAGSLTAVSGLTLELPAMPLNLKAPKPQTSMCTCLVGKGLPMAKLGVHAGLLASAHTQHRLVGLSQVIC